MKLKEILTPTNYVYAIFLLLGFLGIIYLKGIDTAFFLFLFLIMFGLTGHSLVGLYNLLRGIKEKWLVWQLISSIILGIIINYQYGYHALQRAVSLSVVIGVVIVLYVAIFNKSK